MAIVEPISGSKARTARLTPAASGRTSHPDVGPGVAPAPRDRGPDVLAMALGWFSIGLGLAELLAPRRVAWLVGIADTGRRRTGLRLCGLRELAAGVGILASRKPGPWLWSRVGGDVVDLGLLATAMRWPDADPERLGAATAAVVGVTALDVLASERMMRRAQGGIQVRARITVNRPAPELYRFWHDFENLPRFMRHLDTVQTRPDGRSHWRARGPAGAPVAWDAEIVNDQPNERITWRSLPGAVVPNAGTVRFVAAPGGRGTELQVDLEYDPPGGAIGAGVARLFGREPAQQVASDLRRLKQLLETGEITTARGPAARRRRSLFGR